MNKLIVAAILLWYTQGFPATNIELPPGEEVTIKSIYRTNDLTTATIDFPQNMISSGTAAAMMHKGCTKDDLHKLLYQARQHLPKHQDYENITGISWGYTRKKSEQLREEANELDAYDKWLDEIDKAIDKDDCD